MKKVIVTVLLIIALLLMAGSSIYGKIVGMVAVDNADTDISEPEVTYKCVDNDFSSRKPTYVRGTVVVSSSDGKRMTYTDSCVDQDTIKEFSCSSKTNQESFVEYSCSNYDRVCRFGRCVVG